MPRPAESLPVGAPTMGRLAFLAALLVQACGGDPPTPPPPPPPPPPAVAQVTVEPSAAEVFVGSSQPLAATPRDAAGTPLTGRGAPAWNSFSPSIATVGADGTVTGVAPGTANIGATIEGKLGTAAITVVKAPVATVTVSPPAATLQVAATQELTVTIRDAANNVLTDRSLNFVSDNLSVATVSGNGVVTAVGPGTAIVTATSEGKSGSATITVPVQAGAPMIQSIAPGTLVPGASATITGTGFAATANQNVVTIGGVTVPVLGGGATSLTVTVPCINGGAQAIQVSQSGLVSLPFAGTVGTTQHALAVGQAAILTDPAASACSEILFGGSAGRYLIMVYNVSTSPNFLADYTLAGTPPPAGSDPLPPPLIAPRPRSLLQPPVTAEARRQAEWDREHAQRLENNIAILKEGRARTAGQLALDPPVVQALPSLGEMRTFTFPANGCFDTSETIDAKAVYVGTRAVIWEDQNNTVQSSSLPTYAAGYQRIGTLFDQEQYDIVKETFGDPLRRDLDGDQRVHMIFTQKVNSFAAAFVTSCDQFPTSTFPASNFGEFFYGAVPVTATPNPNSSGAPDGWLYFMMRTVVHEVKHIASFAARIENSAPVFEEGWQEESTARHAEEVWVRADLHRVAWKGNTGWGAAPDNLVFCDFHLSDATCTAADPAHRPSWGMRRHFDEFKPKLLEPWNYSPFGTGSGQSGSAFYQIGWSLIRYTIDRYGASDAGFLMAMNQALTSGTTNLTARAGASIETILGGWGLALYADDYPGLVSASADLQFPTWNLRDIYAGLNGDPSWASQYPSPFLLTAMPLTPGAFSTTQLGIRGGGHAYYEMVGVVGGRQLLQLRSTSGGTPSPSLRVAIARLQ